MFLKEVIVLDECISRISSKYNISPLLVYKTCRKQCTTRVVPRAISSSSFIAHTMGRSGSTKRVDEDGSNLSGEYLAQRDAEFGPWLFGYVIFRDVEEYLVNEVEKGREE